MSDEITFYTNPRSRGRIVRWMLEEVGAPYRTEVVDYGAAMKAPGYLAINPMGKVPAIRHRGAIVTEGAAICAYLAEAFPDAGLLGEDRAAYYRWLFFAAGPVEAAVTNHALGLEPPEDRRAMVGYGSYQTTMDTLEAAVSTPGYIAGPRFSAADLFLGSHVGFGLTFGTIEARPALTAYWGRIKDRPARLRAEEIDNALIPA